MILGVIQNGHFEARTNFSIEVLYAVSTPDEATASPLSGLCAQPIMTWNGEFHTATYTAYILKLIKRCKPYHQTGSVLWPRKICRH